MDRFCIPFLALCGVLLFSSTAIAQPGRHHGPYFRPGPPHHHHHHHHGDGAAAAFAFGSLLNFAATVHAINNQPEVVVVEKSPVVVAPPVVVQRPVVVERPVIVEKTVVVQPSVSPAPTTSATSASVFDRGSSGPVSYGSASSTATKLIPSSTAKAGSKVSAPAASVAATNASEGVYSTKLGAEFRVQKIQIPGSRFTAVRLVSAPVEGSPLAVIGLNKGDVITRLNGKPATDTELLDRYEGEVDVQYIKTGTTRVRAAKIAIPAAHQEDDTEYAAP